MRCWIDQIMVERECGPLERRCTSCGKVRPRGWFRKAGVGKSGVRYASRCRECRRESDSRHAARRRGAGVKRIGRDFLKVLLARQGWVCACGCRRSFVRGLSRRSYRSDCAWWEARGVEHSAFESTMQPAQEF